MSAFASSCVLSVLLAPTRRLNATARRWRRFSGPFFDPYRPELHYMRGPGPKWREKHKHDGGANPKV
jgi:hypothetical protein